MTTTMDYGSSTTVNLSIQKPTADPEAVGYLVTVNVIANGLTYKKRVPLFFADFPWWFPPMIPYCGTTFSFSRPAGTDRISLEIVLLRGQTLGKADLL